MNEPALQRANERMYGRYLGQLALVLVVAMLLCGAVNLFVDPYMLFRVEAIRSLPLDLTFEREIRFNLISARRPKTLFLGASQVAIAFDPRDPVVPDRAAFNAGIDGGTLSESDRLLRQATKVGRVGRVILGLSYNATGHVGPDRFNDLFLKDSADPFKQVEAFFSVAMLRSSAKAVFDGFSGRPSQMNDDGQLTSAPLRRQVRGYGSVRAAFDSLTRPDTGHISKFIGSLRQLLADACRAHAEVTVALLPDHAVNLELFAAAGQWGLFEQWKREVVAVDARAACPVRTVDFEDYNFVTTEPLPPKGSSRAMMYYWDPGHFTAAAGRFVLQRVFANAGGLKATPRSFGNDLDPGNVESALRRVDQERRVYEAANRSEVLSIVADVNASR
jgi:hypothetical protein